MVQAIEINSVRRGYDPRDFALVAFGGGGPLFACEIARELDIPNVVVPPAPGLTSALGLLTTDVAYEQGMTVMQVLSDIDLGLLATRFREIEDDIRLQLARDGFGDGETRFLRFADCRYRGQGHELRTPAPGGCVDESFAGSLRDAFDQQHMRAYGHVYAGRDVQIVNIRVVGTGAVPRLEGRRIAVGGATPPEGAMTARRPVHFEIAGAIRSLDTPRYARALLKAGNRMVGPAIIDQMDTTTVIPPGFGGRVDDFGNLLIAAT
jgi:N-methylhydantoinase A/oxoprolinase/acetone carboxylase beta subunit